MLPPCCVHCPYTIISRNICTGCRCAILCSLTLAGHYERQSKHRRVGGSCRRFGCGCARHREEKSVETLGGSEMHTRLLKYVEKTASSALRKRIQVVLSRMEAPGGIDEPYEGFANFSMLFDGKRVGRARVTLPAQGTPWVSSTSIDPAYQGMGLGKKLYGEMLRRVPGGVLNSDSNVTNEAVRVWESMAKRRDKAGNRVYGNIATAPNAVPGRALELGSNAGMREGLYAWPSVFTGAQLPGKAKIAATPAYRWPAAPPQGMPTGAARTYAQPVEATTPWSVAGMVKDLRAGTSTPPSSQIFPTANKVPASYTQQVGANAAQQMQQGNLSRQFVPFASAGAGSDFAPVNTASNAADVASGTASYMKVVGARRGVAARQAAIAKQLKALPAGAINTAQMGVAGYSGTRLAEIAMAEGWKPRAVPRTAPQHYFIQH